MVLSPSQRARKRETTRPPGLRPGWRVASPLRFTSYKLNLNTVKSYYGRLIAVDQW